MKQGLAGMSGQRICRAFWQTTGQTTFSQDEIKYNLAFAGASGVSRTSEDKKRLYS